MTPNVSSLPASACTGWRSRFGPWVKGATYLYAALVLAALILIRWVGNSWWGVAPLLFVPRWLFLAPVGVLAFLAAWLRAPALWLVQGASALVVAGPLMGLSLPLTRLGSTPPAGDRFRILCFNLGSMPYDAGALTAYIEREHIDLVCLQEGARDDPVLEAFFAQGWQRDEEKYVASRYPIVRELKPMPHTYQPDDRWTAHLNGAFIRAPSGREFLLASTHLPTLRPGLNRLLEGDVQGLRLHQDWWRSELERVVGWLDHAQGAPLVVAGDFNVPPDDSTLAALRMSYRFAFEEAGWGYGYTRPARVPWFRIDHVLTSPEWDVARCWVGPNFGSDHLPLIAEVVLPLPPER
jgi:endonuclease/exonuclease/phosphatase family metal-dependent hydrolase